jgi:hypothetical protein
MAIQLNNLLSGIKKAVVEANQSVSAQHMEELQNFFNPVEGSDTIFPNGNWEAKTVSLLVPKEVSKNGNVNIENHVVQVPLIALVPVKSYMIHKVEILTSLKLSVSNLSQDALDGEENLPLNTILDTNSLNNDTEIKIVIQSNDNVPEGYARIISAYSKVLNAQLPN